MSTVIGKGEITGKNDLIVDLNEGVMEDGWAKGWMEGATILIAVVIIVSISAGNNYVKE